MSEENLIIWPEIPLDPKAAPNQPLIDLYREKRRELIQFLRQVPAVAQVARTLAEGKTYRVYIPPEILKQLREGTAYFGTRKDTGFLSTSILDAETGKIIQNVSLVEVSPDLLISLNQLAVQQTLANIVQRLEVMEEKVTDVLQGQHNDRLADIESGVHIYEQAVVATDPETRRGLLISAIQKLNDGRNRLLKSTDVLFVDTLPRSRLGMFFSPIPDIPKYVEGKAEPVWQSAHAIIKATRYMVLAYAILEEPASLQVSLQQSETEIRKFEEKVRQIVNWLPPTAKWRESLVAIGDGVVSTIRQLETGYKAIVIEFQPNELAPPEEL